MTGRTLKAFQHTMIQDEFQFGRKFRLKAELRTSCFHTVSGVGGLFKSCLHRKADPLLSESHPREWVDCSSPAYIGRPIHCFPNPTHGSGWIVQVLPT